MCDSPSRVILGGGIFFLNVQSLRVSTEPKKIKKVHLFTHIEPLILVPNTVWEESTQKKPPNYEFNRELKSLKTNNDIDKLHIEDREVIKLSEEFSKRLSPGECDVLAYAIENNLPVASDEKVVRELARKNSIPCSGSLGFLKNLYKNGFLDFSEALNHHTQMCKNSFYSPFSESEFKSWMEE